MTGLFRLLLVLMSFLFLVLPAHAHRPGESYVFFQAPEENVLTGRFEIYVRDLNKELPIDDDGNGKMWKPERERHGAAITARMQKTLKLTIDGVEHLPVVGELSVRKGGEVLMIPFTLPGVTRVPETIEAEYSFLWDGPIPNHRAFAVIEENYRTGAKDLEANVVAGFGPGEERQVVDFRIPPRIQVVWTFVKHGVWHIWIGFDHILFILALLLPAVLERKDGKWVPVADFKTAMRALLRVVTMFTLAHSVTLSLAAVQVISLNERLVESTIALSIGVMAFNNIKPIFNDRSYLAIFAFGLFHGLGFASVMEPLGLQPAVLLTSLVGFNVGVELGQLAIVSVVFPVLFLLRGKSFYVPTVLVGGSAILTVVSMYWFTERLLLPIFARLIG